MSKDSYRIVSNPVWGFGIRVDPADGTPFVLEKGFSTMEAAFARLLFLLDRWIGGNSKRRVK